jgi:O-antigen/teichoic acid export membrane protein
LIFSVLLTETVQKQTLRGYLSRGGAIVAISRAAALGLTLITSVLLTRLLPPPDVGIFFLFATIASVAATCAQLGLPRTLVRFLVNTVNSGNGDAARDAVSRSLMLAGLGSIVGLVFLAAGPGAALVHWLGSEAAGLSMLLVGLLAAARALEGLFGEVFRGLQRLGHAALFGSLLSSSILVAGLWLLVRYDHRDPSWTTEVADVLALVVVAASCAALLGGLALRPWLRIPPKGRLRDFRDLLSSSWPILCSGLLAMVAEVLGIWIVSGLTQDETQVALYGIALRISLLVGTPLVIANGVLMPVIARLYSEGERDRLTGILQLSATLTTIPSALAVILFAMFGRLFLGLAFGSFYSQAADLLVLLSLAQLLSVWSGACGLALLMTGDQSLHLRLNIWSLGGFLTAGLVLTHFFGVRGMAVAALLAGSCQQLLFVLGTHRRTGLWTCGTLDRRRLRKAWDSLRSIAAASERPETGEPTAP